MVVGDRNPSLPLIDPLAEVRREAPDLTAIAEKVRNGPSCLIGQSLVSPVAREKSTDRSFSDVLMSVKRERVSLRCDADNPIIVSDDEIREEPSQVSKQVSKGNEGRESRLVFSKDARSGTFRSDGLAEATAEDSVANKELNGVEGGTDRIELPSQSGVMPSREDLYYDEADREKLASWAEFPQEVELAK